MRRRFAAVGMALALAACGTTPTPYAPVGGGSSYGYSDQRLDANTWRVTFAGNAATPRTTVDDYLLYRAAEISTTEGASSFVVIKETMERDLTYHGGPVFGVAGARRFRHGFYHRRAFGFPGYGFSRVGPVKRYFGEATIRLYRQAPPAGQGASYDARSVLEIVGPRVVRPQDGEEF